MAPDQRAIWLASRARNIARMRPPAPRPAGQTCGWCGTLLPGWRVVKGAQYCARRCKEQAAVSRAEHPITERFPHATTLADVPQCCSRCDGPWRRVGSGVSCLLCGHEVVVAECLEAMATRDW